MATATPSISGLLDSACLSLLPQTVLPCLWNTGFRFQHLIEIPLADGTERLSDLTPRGPMAVGRSYALPHT
ncbi:hypothetical protein LX32DRAFT_638727 [Colletotrichum zoysiae]|uniref:Uncharacterized protein n=1 Tax=Colletotrichum zoysiae TaxID=1216348 RepID=A0AAD9M1Z2_9PEZI|nr:hypothetical protein LX32DRAFT_638727 [Colletotrichum zoysiae]